MADEEGIGTPSAPRRREVDLGRGVVILPPERIKTETKEEPKPETRKEEISPKPIEQKRTVTRTTAQLPPPTIAPNIQNLLLIGIGVLAVIAIIMSLIAMTSVTSMKSELKGIVADLRAFGKSELTLSPKLEGDLSINSSVPLKETISPFSLPVPPHELEGRGNITVMLPGYSFPINIPWNGTLTVSGSVSVNTSQLADDRTMAFSFTLPGTAQTTMKVAAMDIFKGYIENVTNRLEKLSK